MNTNLTPVKELIQRFILNELGTNMDSMIQF